MPHPLARIVDQLKREPSRTGSIVITVFGDAIMPRGGSVWLGTLLEFFKTLDIDSGVVRTATSRSTRPGAPPTDGSNATRSAATVFIVWRKRAGRPSIPRPNTSTIRKLQTGQDGSNC